MKLLMENWRNFVSLEEDADKANQEINGLINEYISRNPSLLKEYSPAFLGLLDDEDDEEEAEEVIDDIEDEVEDELEDEEEEEEESSYDDAEVDTSIGDEASRIGTKVGVGAGAVARFVLATSGELVNQIALGTYPLIMKALGSAAGLRNFVKGLGRLAAMFLRCSLNPHNNLLSHSKKGKK